MAESPRAPRAGRLVTQVASATRRASTVPPGSPGAQAALGGFIFLMGLVPFLAAIDVIRSPDSDFGAPRWMVALLVVPFMVIGAGFVVAAVGRTDLWPAFGAVAAAIFVNGMAALLTWLIVTDRVTSGRSMISIGPIVLPGSAWVDRILVGVFAVLVDALAIAFWVWVVGKLVRSRRR